MIGAVATGIASAVKLSDKIGRGGVGKLKQFVETRQGKSETGNYHRNQVNARKGSNNVLGDKSLGRTK